MESTTEQVGIRELLEAGVHFGHQAKRWNPKMKPYIFAERAGVHVIDLDQTLPLLGRARSFVRSIAEADRNVLFVGTKKQAQITVAEHAIRCGQPYVAERYIGGMLTNFQTIKPRIEYFKDLSARFEETPEEERTGRDWFALAREYQKMRRNFAGLTEMERLPGAVFVIDPKREELMVKEANRLRIPVVALTDTNCDPEVIDYVIPGNDDAIRSINLVARLIAGAILEGKGEDEVQPEERPVPPVVEEARLSEGGTVEEVASNGDVTLEEGAIPQTEVVETDSPTAGEPALEEPAADVADGEATDKSGAADPEVEEAVPSVEDTDLEASGGDTEAAAAAAAEAAAEDVAAAPAGDEPAGGPQGGTQEQERREDPEAAEAAEQEEES